MTRFTAGSSPVLGVHPRAADPGIDLDLAHNADVCASSLVQVAKSGPERILDALVDTILDSAVEPDAVKQPIDPSIGPVPNVVITTFR